jgi:hypothetical protein
VRKEGRCSGYTLGILSEFSGKPSEGSIEDWTLFLREWADVR